MENPARVPLGPEHDKHRHRSCTSKIRYATPKEAKKAIRHYARGWVFRGKRHPPKLTYYVCIFCGGCHLTSSNKK